MPHLIEITLQDTIASLNYSPNSESKYITIRMTFEGAIAHNRESRSQGWIFILSGMELDPGDRQLID
ncbi:hypothetical protein [Laspinema olomoucense]|uniref:hypothetical protein n=1 Tax=Laspinema olomoucense TaxID=3231600 RepID=UPI0021BB7936|nr:MULTISPECIES: hypothetical protein [unclassified Laspinema]